MYYNYKTQQFAEMPDEMTEEVCQRFIPQEDAVLGLYTCLVKMGKTPLEAAIDVLERITGKQQRAA